MDRRTACASMVAIAAGHASGIRAQSARVLRVACVTLDAPATDAPAMANFLRGMRERGYVEGRSLVVESYYAHGNVDRIVAQLPAIAATRPDAVVVLGGQLVRALKEAGFTLPVVFIYSGDPVEAKFAASFARPGGNFTGVSLFMAELVTKRIEILREMLPRARRIAFIGWSRHAGVGVEVRVSLDAAKRAGMEANYLPADNGADIAAAYDEAARTGAQAVFPFPDAVSLAAASAMSEYSRRHRMPTIAGWAEFTLQGNLMSYGPNREAVYAHLASFVDRIAKGAKAADIPIERPTVHEFVVNLKAARDLGITIPPSILARASQAID